MKSSLLKKNIIETIFYKLLFVVIVFFLISATIFLLSSQKEWPYLYLLCIMAYKIKSAPYLTFNYEVQTLSTQQCPNKDEISGEAFAYFLGIFLRFQGVRTFKSSWSFEFRGGHAHPLPPSYLGTAQSS